MIDTLSDLRFAAIASTRPIGLKSKRIIDIILALSGIVLLAPLLIICFIATVATSRGPALFRHRRAGGLKRPQMPRTEAVLLGHSQREIRPLRGERFPRGRLVFTRTGIFQCWGRLR